MNKIKIGTTCLIIGALLSLILTKLYWPTEKIKIVDRIVYKTEWKTKIEYTNTPENFDALWKCYNSEIKFEDKVKDDKLKVRAYDDCKENTIEYKIKVKNIRHHIIQAGYIYQFEIGSIYEVAYLYNFNEIITFGGGILINKNNPGLKIILQKAF